MADALGSGPSPGNRVEVQVLSSALVSPQGFASSFAGPFLLRSPGTWGQFGDNIGNALGLYMASLETRHGPKKGPRFRLVFRLQGQKYQQFLAATSQSEAEQIKAAAERTLDLIAEGRVTVPEGADIGLFDIERLLGHQLLRAGVLPLQGPQLLGHLRNQTAILLAPTVVGQLLDLECLADRQHLLPLAQGHVRLTQLLDDLIGRVSRLPHLQRILHGIRPDAILSSRLVQFQGGKGQFAWHVRATLKR